MDQIERTLVWRLRDEISLEYFSLGRSESGWFLSGTVVAATDDQWPMLVRYRVECNEAWETHAVEVAQSVAGNERTLGLTVNSERRWLANGHEVEALRGCIDVDLGVTPATNTLPIRRLGLRPGESVTIEAAWVRFPALEIVRAAQGYVRSSDLHYVYVGSQRSYEL